MSDNATGTLATLLRSGALFQRPDPDDAPPLPAEWFKAATKVPAQPYREWQGAVVLGRFQPLHDGHMGLIRGALEIADKVLVVIGSAWEAASLKNPFSYDMRRVMVEHAFKDEIKSGRIVIDGLQDYKYRTAKWNKEFAKVVGRHFKGVYEKPNASVCFFTFGKDEETKKYIGEMDKRLPQRFYEPTNALIDATTVRQSFFNSIPTMNIPYISTQVAFALHAYKMTDDYAKFCKEQAAIKAYHESWASAPFPPVFVAVDGLITWKDRWGKPYILVGVRKSDFGNGKLALPGGFLEVEESIYKSAVREVKEETTLTVDDSFILDKVHVFDDPGRSMRGRMITHVHEWRCMHRKQPKVAGQDDFSDAFWLPIDEVYARKRDFFSDHYFIISAIFPTVEEFDDED